MKYYELTCLISSDISDPNLQTFRDEITSFIQEKGGILEETENPAKIKLGYSIKKNEEGILVNLNFYFDPANLEDLQKFLKQKSQILRYLIFAQKIPKKKPKIVVPKMAPLKKVEVLAEEKLVSTKRREKVDLKEIEEKLKEILGE